MEKILYSININKESVIPIYHQIKEQLQNLIDRGIIENGDRIPSENELSSHFDISRMTARNAVEELVKQGIVKRERGKGSIVFQPKIDQSLMKIQSFTKAMNEKGYTIRADLLDFEVGTSSTEIQKRLKLEDNDKIIRLSRIRCIENTPVGLQYSYLPFKLTEPLIQHKNKLENTSLYTLLREYCSINPTKTHETLEIKKATAKQNKLLNIPLNEPLFYVEALAECEKGPMEYVESYYRSDVFKFHIKSEL